MHQDFSTFGAEQLDELLKLTIKIARRLAHRMSRRRRPVKRRGRVDLRRTLRANLTRGDLIELRYRERKRKKIRLVLLCDVSGSMDLYSRFLLQFLFALQNVFGRVETFIFSTRLTRVTEYLRGRSYRHVLRRLTESQPKRPQAEDATEQDEELMTALTPLQRQILRLLDIPATNYGE